MLIPISTDAPLYHRPWATLGLIAANVVVFVICLAEGGPDPAEYMLWYGDGLHPVQWLSSTFVHGGIEHLLGNMLFLWAFGLVIEGKVGWWKFLALYLGVGTLQSGLEQCCLLGAEPWNGFGDRNGSLGASAAIYGLMAMALVWAPKNDLQCFYWFGWRAGMAELSILFFAGLDLAVQMFLASLTGFSVGTETLHLSGAVLGLTAAVVMLKRDLVDCEGWDLFSVWSGRAGNTLTAEDALKRDLPTGTIPRPKPRKPKPPRIEIDDDEEDRMPPHLKLLAKLRTNLKQNKTTAALREWRRIQHVAPEYAIPEPDLFRLTDAAYREQIWDEAILLMEECWRRCPEHCQKLRVKLADAALRIQRRPGYALKVLDGLDRLTLPDDLQKLAETTHTQAQQLIDEGLYELEGRAWNT